ncbi:hypothetical protein K490DRAFT_54942 [Saccharata proteae CBS 121410]|uniref:RNI-like protein n=1 Tax=Saccharata proteae CBS 121410 TaxID=1314787 RepID=A0A6A5YCW5_9PEZI|nr:hypothetical protein K490DRAFT_54942 [Saccharata proteae CBS 121410]
MCKLNYKNRKSDGPKLGGIVAKDLRNQTRKCFAKADPRPEQSPLVLELQGKKLTDEGCVAMVGGLSETIASRDGVCCNKLEELHLTGNDLTTKSLRALAEVIRLSSFDLKDLDLSDNNITVGTDQQAKDWEFFLQSFEDCRVLRRLQFSGNELGPRAHEVLARVYAKQPIVDPTELEEYNKHTNGTNSSESLVEITNRARAMSIKSPTDDRVSPTNSLHKGTVLKRRQGLRSIPYIIFSNTGLNDQGALFLSYVLAIHYYPQYLLCPLRSNSQAVQLDEENHKNHCWGLVYLPNKNISDTGHKLLQHAEENRVDFTGIEHDIADGNVPSSMGSFVTVAASPMAPATRRSSHGSSEAEREKKHAVNMSLENYRHKVQRSVLDWPGYRSVELWRCALKMLAYARAVLITNGQDSFEKTPSSLTVQYPLAQLTSTHAYVSRMLATSTDAPEPIFGVTGVSDEPTIPQVPDFSNSTSDKKNYNNPPSLLQQQIMDSRNAAAATTHTTTLHARIEASDHNDREPDNLGQLPHDVWRHILTLVSQGYGVLSEEQQVAIMEYAKDPANRDFEKSHLGMPECSQIWHIVDKMGCLEYLVKG